MDLCNKIDIENAAENFLAAYLHVQAQQLKKCSLDFILQNYEEVKKTPGFVSFLQHPNALVEILDMSVRMKKA